MIKHIYITIVLLLSVLIVASCGENTKITKPITADSINAAFGTDQTFDLITWNIENFPKHNPDTTNLLKVLIPNLQVECIAIQEIADVSALSQLISQVPNWSYIASGSGDGYTRTGIIYNNQTVQVDSVATLFAGESNPFPRAPLLVKMLWHNHEIYVISLHLKASGDNVIDESDSWDEEVRRRTACQDLDQYISTYLADKQVIVSGDWNDQIQEPVSTNVFMSLINKPEEYKFTDMTIAQNFNLQTCSYPGSYSHIDHILITNELFSAFDASGDYVRTIPIENYVSGGLTNYKKYISDHRPVGARFNFIYD